MKTQFDISQGASTALTPLLQGFSAEAEAAGHDAHANGHRPRWRHESDKALSWSGVCTGLGLLASGVRIFLEFAHVYNCDCVVTCICTGRYLFRQVRDWGFGVDVGGTQL